MDQGPMLLSFGAGLSDRPAPKLKSIFLCMVPRSGSTFFGAMLRDNGLGNCVESFRVVKGMLERDLATSEARTYEDYIRYKIAKFRRGDVFSSKVDWLQFIPIYYLGMWRKFFTPSHFIYLTREDVLMQAISRHIGTESGLFHSPQIEKASNKPAAVAFDYEKILQHINHLVQMMSAWETFFALEHLQPLRVSYEQLSADPEGVLQAVSEFTGIPLPAELKIENEFEPVSGDLNAQLRDQFVAESRKQQMMREPQPVREKKKARPGPAQPKKRLKTGTA